MCEYVSGLYMGWDGVLVVGRGGEGMGGKVGKGGEGREKDKVNAQARVKLLLVSLRWSNVGVCHSLSGRSVMRHLVALVPNLKTRLVTLTKKKHET